MKKDIQETILPQQILESFTDVLMFAVDTKLNYTAINSAFKAATFQVYGIEVEVGMNMLDSITNEADKKKAGSNCNIALGGKHHVTIEAYGEIIRHFFETRYYPILSEEAEIIGVSVFSINVSDRELAKERIQELISDLESFSYSVSHDLRAPLRAIAGFSEILMDKYLESLDERGQHYLNVVKTNADQMGVLIDDLLNFSRIGRSKLTAVPVDITNLVKGCVQSLTVDTPLYSEYIAVSDLVPVICDASLMKHVFQNLIGNAIKYSSKEKQPKIEIGSKTEENNIVYFVKDNGIGFDMNYKEKLFKVFERLHSNEEFAGSGIGLALAHKIIDKHKGKIWAESEPGKGACFYFSIPGKLEKHAG